MVRTVWPDGRLAGRPKRLDHGFLRSVRDLPPHMNIGFLLRPQDWPVSVSVTQQDATVRRIIAGATVPQDGLDQSWMGSIKVIQYRL